MGLVEVILSLCVCVLQGLTSAVSEALFFIYLFFFRDRVLFCVALAVLDPAL